MQIDFNLNPTDLTAGCQAAFEAAATKSRSLDESWDTARGAPVFTIQGQYTTRGWTEWTEGFMIGNMILAGEALDDDELIERGRTLTLQRMLPHVTHTGVHDHGFNNLSTYGQLRRLLNEGRTGSPTSRVQTPKSETGEDRERFAQFSGRVRGYSEDAPVDWERLTYENAIAASGAVQASRWAGVPVKEPNPLSANSRSLGYVTSFNGPHSLFIDTMRSLRVLDVAWQLGHVLKHEGDCAANLLKRSVLHGLTTNQTIIFHGESAHTYDVPGRTAHEGIFNRADGAFRCRSTQQGYSPFSTWTRGLAWAMLGYSEQLEFFQTIDDQRFEAACGLPRAEVMRIYERTARETCDHYIDDASASDGVPYWDAGAPRLHELGDWQSKPADPYNDHEPVDSSAGAIAAQGLLRLGQYLKGKGDTADAERYTQAGLTLSRALFDKPYLSTDDSHQGLLLQSVYHVPNGWDHIPEGRSIPCDEACLWGDYHLLELALLLQRLATQTGYPTFFS